MNLYRLSISYLLMVGYDGCQPITASYLCRSSISTSMESCSICRSSRSTSIITSSSFKAAIEGEHEECIWKLFKDIYLYIDWFGVLGFNASATARVISRR